MIPLEPPESYLRRYEEELERRIGRSPEERAANHLGDLSDRQRRLAGGSFLQMITKSGAGVLGFSGVGLGLLLMVAAVFIHIEQQTKPSGGSPLGVAILGLLMILGGLLSFLFSWRRSRQIRHAAPMREVVEVLPRWEDHGGAEIDYFVPIPEGNCNVPLRVWEYLVPSRCYQFLYFRESEAFVGATLQPDPSPRASQIPFIKQYFSQELYM